MASRVTTATDSTFTVPLNGDRSLTLRVEPGQRVERLYRLALTSASGLQAGGFTGSAGEIVELFLALQHLAATVDRRGLPGQ